MLREVIVGVSLIGLLLAAAAGGCQQQPGAGDQTFPTVPPSIKVPDDLKQGEILFNRNCAGCHGERGVGTPSGPPLVHITYEPNHHADSAFQFAVRNGVQAHHWNFGNMPPIQGVSDQDVQQIIGYVRFLQRQVGIE